MNATLMHAVIRLTDSRTSDADLLDRFKQDRDERAFEELVRRHGPLVWSVCRHLLPHHADAEDAFQAVFLALVRSASAIRAGQALPAWLHGVSVRVAAKVKRGAVRRRQREQRVAIPEADRPVPDGTWSALMTAVHEEVRQLPDAERTAFVLCDLEGVRQPDAAARLGWPLGTLSGRLCKARQRLLEQLTRRGIAPGVLAIGGVAASAGTVPAALLKQVSSFPAAKAGVSSTVAELARGLVEGATMRTKVLAATLLVAGSLGIGSGAMVLSKADAQTPDVVKEAKDLLAGLGAGQPPAAGGGGGAFPGGAGAAGGPAAFPGGPGGAFPPGQGRPPQGGSGGRAGGADGGTDPGAVRPGSEGGRASAPAHAVEYKFVDLLSDERAPFVKAITDAGKDGWEYCGSERLRVAGDRLPLVLVFKKQRGGGGPGAFFGGMGMPGGGGGGGAGGGMMLGSGGGPGAGMMPGGGGGLGGLIGGGGGARGGMELPGMGAFSGLMGGGGDVDVKTFRLKNASSLDVVGPVEKAFPKAKMLKVIGEPNSNSIIIVADSTTIKEATKLIESLDGKPKAGASGPGDAGPRGGGGRGPTGAPGGSGAGLGPVGPMGGPPGGSTGGGPPRGSPMGAGTGGDARAGGITVYSLKNASADELAAVLKKVFPTAEITAESRTNQLIVRIGEKDAADFEKLIQRLDTK